MKTPFTQYLYSVLRQLSQEFRQFATRGAQASLRTPLPRIALVLMAILVLLSLIPFILALFIAFFVFRVFLGLLSPAQRKPANANSYGSAEPAKEPGTVRYLPRQDQ